MTVCKYEDVSLQLCGLAILIVGVIAHLQLTHYAEAIKENVMFPSITLIVIGTVIFIIAFFGCCGAIRESHCMTVTVRRETWSHHATPGEVKV